jgi:hypothetical protein
VKAKQTVLSSNQWRSYPKKIGVKVFLLLSIKNYWNEQFKIINILYRSVKKLLEGTKPPFPPGATLLIETI